MASGKSKKMIENNTRNKNENPPINRGFVEFLNGFEPLTD